MTDDFSVHDAIEVLRLLDDDPNETFEMHRHGLRFQCVRDARSLRTGTQQTGSQVKQDPRRHTMLKAPAAGRFYGDAALFSPGPERVRVTAGTIVGRIESGATVTVIMTDVEGNVAHRCVTPDAFVEYGQTLLVIETAQESSCFP